MYDVMSRGAIVTKAATRVAVIEASGRAEIIVVVASPEIRSPRPMRDAMELVPSVPPKVAPSCVPSSAQSNVPSAANVGRVVTDLVVMVRGNLETNVATRHAM
jgi:hypothetical protein